MTEAYADIDKTMLWYGNGEKSGAHFTFNFGLIGITNDGNGVSAEKIKEVVVDDWLNKLCSGCTSNWVVSKQSFQINHSSCKKLRFSDGKPRQLPCGN